MEMTITRPKETPDTQHAIWIVEDGEGRWSFSKIPDDFKTANNYVIVTENGDWSGFRTFQEILKQKMPDYPDAHLKYWVIRR